MTPALDVLAIAAHRDDAEQTCGGVLIRAAERGYRTGVLDLTAGEMGTRGDAETRAREAEEAAREMLLAWRGNLGLPDAKLEATLEAKLAIAAKIRENYFRKYRE
jgi:LmbE family N-acetylglucosaminyl deacetylase